MARILIVDNEALDCMIFESLLTQLGHEPTFAESAEVGLDLYAPEEFDLVITDLVLPEMSGLQLMVKLLARDPNASIIAVSGRGNDQLGTARKYGAVGLLTKPLNFNRLQAMLARTIPPSATDRGEVPLAVRA